MRTSGLVRSIWSRGRSSTSFSFLYCNNCVALMQKKTEDIWTWKFSIPGIKLIHCASLPSSLTEFLYSIYFLYLRMITSLSFLRGDYIFFSTLCFKRSSLTTQNCPDGSGGRMDARHGFLDCKSRDAAVGARASGNLTFASVQTSLHGLYTPAKSHK